MTVETEIIIATLEDQAKRSEENRLKCSAVSQQHQGARDIIPVIVRNMAGIMGQAETEVLADENLDKDSRAAVLSHIGRTLKRVSSVLMETQKNQTNMTFLSIGEATAHQKAAESLRKQIEIRRGIDRAREESVAMGDANKNKSQELKRAKRKGAKNADQGS